MGGQAHPAQPEPPAAKVRETNTSVVLLMGDRAHKVKKSADLSKLHSRNGGGLNLRSCDLPAALLGRWESHLSMLSDLASSYLPSGPSLDGTEVPLGAVSTRPTRFSAMGQARALFDCGQQGQTGRRPTPCAGVSVVPRQVCPCRIQRPSSP
jgi:hypothetical protein